MKNHVRQLGCLAMALAAGWVGGCAGRPALFPNSDPALRQTSTQFAADAAKRHPFRTDLPPGGEAAGRAQVDYMFDWIQVTNMSDDDWNNIEIWVNRQYVVFVPKIAAGNTLKTLNFQMLYDDHGNYFPPKSGLRVEHLEMLRNGRMYTIPVRLADQALAHRLNLKRLHRQTRALQEEFAVPRQLIFQCGMIVVLLAALARADDLLVFQASNTTGTPNTVTAGSSHLINLVDNLLKSQDQFSGINQNGFTATLKYGDLNNAVTINQSVNTQGNKITHLIIPSIGLDRTFNSGNGSIDSQIRDFLRKDGASDLANFLKVVDNQSHLGVSDGNPLAMTAVLSKDAFNRFGLDREPSQLYNEPVDGGATWAIDVEGGGENTDVGQGYYALFTPSATFRPNRVIGLSLALPMMYRELQGTSTYMIGANLGVPITLLPAGGRSGLNWQVTPSVAAAIGGSGDLVAGGILLSPQLTSALSYSIRGWTFTLADHIGYYHGLPVGVGDYKFDTNVNQTLLKNGVQVRKAFGDFFIDASFTYNNYLDDAAVKYWVSPAAGIGLRFGPHRASGLRLGYSGDFGNGYQANGATFNLFFTF